MEQINHKSRHDAFGSKINRDHSPVLLYGIPWLTILLGSLTPLLPIISSLPIVPPLGFVLMLGWRLTRPGLLPLWAGFPIGLFDDLLSGQPMGSGILLFSLALIAVDFIELRFPWTGFRQNWLIAAVLTLLYLIISALISGTLITRALPSILLPQLLLSLIIFPMVSRMIGLLDRFRLMRVRKLG